MTSFHYWSALIITLIISVGWIVMHEQAHREVFDDEGCAVSGIRLNFANIAYVQSECPGNVNWDRIKIRNQAIDSVSQLFVPLIFWTYFLSYIFVKNTE